MAVTPGGRQYTWGDGKDGQLGHGDTADRLVPMLVGAGAFEGSAMVMAACGANHTLLVTHDGALWARGDGGSGQLGLDDNYNRHLFERVGAGAFGGARVVAAAAGKHHSLVVTEDGALLTWGEGVFGQLGHEDEEDRWVPPLVAGAGLGGRADRAVPGAAGGTRGGVCDGHARAAGGSLAGAVPGGGGRAAADDCGLVSEVGERVGRRKEDAVRRMCSGQKLVSV